MKPTLYLLLLLAGVSLAVNPPRKLPSVAIPRSAMKAVPVQRICPGYDITRPIPLDPAMIEKKLGGVLRGKGRFIVAVCRKKGLCPVAFAGVLMHESANGSSRVARSLNNVAGIYDQRKRACMRFKSVEACIEYAASLLASKRYAGGSRRTVEEIQRVYCPVGAKNDPRKLNQHWTAGVCRWMSFICA